MTRQQAEQFISIYNALLTISTKGEDTKTMAKVLSTMEELANNIEVQQPQTPMAPTPAPVEEHSEEGE